MKSKHILILFSLLFFAFIVIGSSSAVDMGYNSTEDSLILSNAADTDFNLEKSIESLNIDSTLSSSDVIVVDEIEKGHNEMSDSTIQKAIDSANVGDTIIVNGSSYVHCHFIVNKKLTILSNINTTLNPCSSNAVSGYRGIFYISPEASGTVIDGFSIKNDVYNAGDYGIFVNGARDVVIKNCNLDNKRLSSDAIRIENAQSVLIQNVSISNVANGIRIKNSQNIKINESVIKDSKYCISIIDSSNATVTSNNISNNNIAGIAISGDSEYVNILSNNISEGNIGINFTSANHVSVLNNYIGFNDRYGIYTDCNITMMEIKGNFINQNAQYDIFNDFHVQNLFVKDGEKLQNITNNYMIGHGERPVWRQVYEYRPGMGEFNYDAEKDVYVFVGQGSGDYYGHQSGTFFGYVFDINEDLNCPNIFYAYPTEGVTPWTKTGNYKLYLSNITQIKKGMYSISIVDVNGNVATEISSVPVTFYLNKNNTHVTPQPEDKYQVVMMKNGTATVKFYKNDFKESGNVLLASFPGVGNNLYSKTYRPYKTLEINDDSIPGNVTETKLTVSNLNTYPKSKDIFIANLTDLNGNPIIGEEVVFKINSKSYSNTTDSNGLAKIKIYQSKEGTYIVDVNYVGDDIDYSSSSAQAKVTVKIVSSKIISSNLYMVPKLAEYYSISLKDTSGNVIANQKVTFKVNKKTYTKKVNSKGIAKLKLKFSKQKTYKIAIKYAGSNKYKAASKTNKIIVKYSSKKAKLTTPAITIPPKTSKTYTVSLKDGNGNGISKQKVIVSVNGKKYIKTTNSKGQVNIQVKFNSLKTYKVSAIYKGSKIYKKASSNGKIKVAKTTTKLISSSLTILPNMDEDYTVTLKTSDGKILPKQKIIFNLNGKTYTKKTNSKGQASVNVKFNREDTYLIVVSYKGTDIYKTAKTSGYIKVSRLAVELTSFDMTFSKDSSQNYSVSLKDKSGNPLANENILFEFNNKSITAVSDLNGIAFVNLNASKGVFDIETTYLGNDKYLATSKVNRINISDKNNTVFINEGLPNEKIQEILDKSLQGSNIEFVGKYYQNISLTINKELNIFSGNLTSLESCYGKPVLTVRASNVNISNFSIIGNESFAVTVENVNNVNLINNIIFNRLNHSLIDDYLESSISMPGYGISILNSNGVKIQDNYISLFESGIFAENSSDLIISNNVLRENNYGIKYGCGVSNSSITENNICENIGLFTMLVPEGPRGYGIFLNNSAVNVKITKNNITWNHLGISVDANHSTGIVIISNVITDNVLEGIRFNEGYDLALNAVEPLVTDNAIYRNARGPSMMILGELSANPAGIYGAGVFNDSLKLHLDSNWYGKNQIITWDNDTGIVGYGTMCPRISTTGIAFKSIDCIKPGKYSITFYKNDEIASNLPVFDMYATLNDDVEVKFDVINGVGIFSFDSQSFKSSDNEIKISIGSLSDVNRIFKVEMSRILQNSEIPI